MRNERLTERREEPLTMSMWAGTSQELRIYNRLAELEDKIENGELFSVPFIWHSDKQPNVYIVVFEDEYGYLTGRYFGGESAKAEAVKKLEELKNGM